MPAKQDNEYSLGLRDDIDGIPGPKEKWLKERSENPNSEKNLT